MWFDNSGFNASWISYKNFMKLELFSWESMQFAVDRIILL